MTNTVPPFVCCSRGFCSLFSYVKFPVKFRERNRRIGGSVSKQLALRSSTAVTLEKYIEFSL
jgi:hypothetical protein